MAPAPEVLPQPGREHALSTVEHRADATRLTAEQGWDAMQLASRILDAAATVRVHPDDLTDPSTLADLVCTAVVRRDIRGGRVS